MKNFEKKLHWIALGILTVAVVAGVATQARAQQGANGSATAGGPVRTLRVRGGIYMLVGPNGNSTLSIGSDGALLVDTMTAPLSEAVKAEIRKLTNLPLRTILNTSYRPEHTGGNEELSKWGGIIVGGNFTAQVGRGAPAAIFAHENVLNRMSAPTGKQSPTPVAAWPSNTFAGNRKDLFFNDEGIRITHVPAAITDGDSVVFFRRSDVISTGEVFSTDSYPHLDLAAGGSINGELAAVNYILGEVIPVYGQEGGTMLVPGHGRISDLGDLVDYREMLTVVRDRVQDMVKKGMTLAQVKASKPTLDYDAEYGSTKGPWTTDAFVEAVYQSLSSRK
jgi:glyoxylase-like metal-dependent hydrolase (beta-lactamase superfamily II)